MRFNWLSGSIQSRNILDHLNYASGRKPLHGVVKYLLRTARELDEL
jgi:hypothetical protein